MVDGKRAIFLADKVPLVIQQAAFLRMHCSVDVGEYYGDKKIDDKVLDCWSKEIWDSELVVNKILVMTPQIFVDMIQHSYLGDMNLKTGTIFENFFYINNFVFNRTKQNKPDHI